MATKLKNLKVTKVDFVDEGANPDAHVPLRKNKEPDVADNKSPGLLHRLFSFVGKAAGLDQAEIESAMEEITKSSSESFGEKFNAIQNERIADEIWEICYALQSSLISILNDGDLDNTGVANAMRESVGEFSKVIDNCVSEWAGGRIAQITKTGEITEADAELMKSNMERMSKKLAEASETEDVTKHQEKSLEEEGEKEMRIDKSKLTPEERAFYEAIEKKAGVEDGTETGVQDSIAPETLAEPEVQKSVAPEQKEAVQEPSEGDSDIYKGLHPEVRAEIESLRKFREEAETRELMSIAKKYEVIGKKAEELVPTLKSLKAAGGTAYIDMIAVLDEAVNTVEKSGAFSEIGKSGHGTGEVSAWAEADAKAVELMKSRAGLTKAQALDEVLQADPELAERCEKED